MHCATCICGRRAPVQARDYGPVPERKPPGSIAWTEHEKAWTAYAARWGTRQSAERMAERGGFGYTELTELLGHEPETWSPRGRES